MAPSCDHRHGTINVQLTGARMTGRSISERPYKSEAPQAPGTFIRVVQNCDTPMQQVEVSVAGFGDVGRSVAKLLLERRERYRAVYGADVRLVAICGSRAGLCDARGIEADWFDALEDGLTGPGFIAASGADIVIEAGPTNIRTGWPGLAYLTAALSEGRYVIAISPARRCGSLRRTPQDQWRSCRGATDDRPCSAQSSRLHCPEGRGHSQRYDKFSPRCDDAAWSRFYRGPARSTGQGLC
jgi:hypothetical protein